MKKIVCLVKEPELYRTIGYNILNSSYTSVKSHQLTSCSVIQVDGKIIEKHIESARLVRFLPLTYRFVILTPPAVAVCTVYCCIQKKAVGLQDEHDFDNQYTLIQLIFMR